MKKSPLPILAALLAAATPILAQGDDETEGAAQRLPLSDAPLGTRGGDDASQPLQQEGPQAPKSGPDFRRELAKLKLAADSVLPARPGHWADGPEFAALRTRIAAAEGAVEAGGDASEPLDAAWEALLEANRKKTDVVVGRISSSIAGHLAEAHTNLLEDTLVLWTASGRETAQERAARDALAAWRRAVDRALEPRDYHAAQKVIDLVNQHGRDLKESVNAAIREACYAHAAEHAADGGDVGELHDRFFPPEERVGRISGDIRSSEAVGALVGRSLSGREIYRAGPDGLLRYGDGQPVPRRDLPGHMR